MANMSKNNESLCEKSMQVVINIIKLSSFSLAKMSPQAPRTSLSGKSTGPPSTKATRSPSPTPQPPRSLKTQKLQKPVSYLLDPVEGNKSMYVIRDQEKSVDGMASDYIRKVYEKIHFDSSEISNLSTRSSLHLHL